MEPSAHSRDLFRRVDLGPVLQQQPHHRLVAVRGSQVEASHPFLPVPRAVARAVSACLGGRNGLPGKSSGTRDRVRCFWAGGGANRGRGFKDKFKGESWGGAKRECDSGPNRGKAETIRGTDGWAVRRLAQSARVGRQGAAPAPRRGGTGTCAGDGQSSHRVRGSGWVG